MGNWWHGNGSRRFAGPYRLGGVALLVASSGCLSENDPGNLLGEDYFNQAPNNQVDILWVVDNSGSMIEEVETLVNGFQSFVGQMEESATDFHIGVVSTSFDYADPNRGILIGDPPYLTASDDYVGEFQIRTQVGVSGSDKEKGLEAAEYALSPTMTLGGPNYGFLRSEALLLIIVVSDEEDCSDRAALEGQPAAACYRQPDKLAPVSEFVDSYRSLKETPDRVMFAGIIGVPTGACEGPYPSKRYSLVAKLTGGLIGDICLSDWSQVLEDLGLKASGIRNSFQLAHGAQEDTIKVWVQEADAEEPFRYPKDEDNGWTYNPDTWFITFGNNAVPGRGAEIKVEYVVDPGAEPPGQNL